MAKSTYNANTDLVKGNDLYLYLYSGDTAEVLAFATSCSLQVDQETIDTSNKMMCRWNSVLGGNASYTINADALYTQAGKEGVEFDDLMQYMLKGDPIKWAIGKCVNSMCEGEGPDYSLDTTAQYYTGSAVVTSLSLEAGNNEIASSSITLTGSGAVERKIA